MTSPETVRLLRFFEWLTTAPSLDEVCRTLVLDFMSEYRPAKCRISVIHQDDSLHFLGDYGWQPSTSGQSLTSADWRSGSGETAGVPISAYAYGWNPGNTVLQVPIRDRGMLLGSTLMIFHEPVVDHVLAGEILMALSTPLSLFMHLTRSNPNFTDHAALFRDVIPAKASDPSNFTKRQLLILNGIVEGKTNHEIALELGFSVSTVRHETMRIYVALGVNDRHSAARSALDQKFI